MMKAIKFILLAMMLSIGVVANVYAKHEGCGSYAMIAKSWEKAFPFCMEIAKTGDASAQDSVGWMLSGGRGVVENDYEAVKWYRLAAEQGYFASQFNLGYQYYWGEGVMQNYKEAYIWLALSATSGIPIYVKHRDNFAKLLSADDLIDAQQEAARRYKKIYAE